MQQGFFARFLSTALGISAGGVIISEYFFYKLDKRLEQIKQYTNEILTNQREEIFQSVEQYHPANIYSNTKEAFINKIGRVYKRN